MYFNVNDFSKAKSLFKKVAETSKRKYYNSLYYLAEILRIQSKYDSAINMFNEYQEKYRKTSRKELLFYLADIRIESCAFAANNNQDTKNYQVRHLNTSINKAHMESAPVIIGKSEFVYSSLIADSIPVINKKVDNTITFHRFYKAKQDKCL